jgi:hypothetical protein
LRTFAYERARARPAHQQALAEEQLSGLAYDALGRLVLDGELLSCWQARTGLKITASDSNPQIVRNSDVRRLIHEIQLDVPDIQPASCTSEA